MLFLEGQFDRVNQLGFTPDGSKLVAAGGMYAGSSTKVAVWKFPEGKLQGTFEGDGHLGNCLEISPDGRYLAQLTPWRHPAVAQVFDLTKLSLTASINSGFDHETQAYGSYGVRFSADGTELDIIALCIARLTIREPREDQLFHFRWNVEGGELSGRWGAELPPRSSYVSEWEFDPTRTWVAITDTRKLLFWNVEKRKIEFELPCATTADPRVHTFSRDGKRLAFASRRSIQTFDVVNRRELARFRNTSTKYIQSMAFSPDGQTLATVSNDTFVRLWESETGREVKTYAWKLGQLKSVTIAPDGMRAAAAGKKGKIVVWDLD